MANTEVRGRGKRRYARQAPKETYFQDRVMRDLRRIPRSWWRKINDRVTSGIVDVIGGVNGLSIVIELKTKTQCTDLQLKHLEEADRANCQSFVATPDNWEEIYRFLCRLNDIHPPQIEALRKPARIPLWTIPARLRERFSARSGSR